MKEKHPHVINAAFVAAAMAIASTGSSFGESILIDFGMDSATVNGSTTNTLTTSPDTNGNYWNNFDVNVAPTYPVPINTNINLISTTNVSTGIKMTVTSTGGGKLAVNGGDALNLPYIPLASITNPDFRVATAVDDVWFMNSGTPGVTTSTFTLSGLSSSMVYTFQILATRPLTAADTRQTLFTAVGNTTISGTSFTSQTQFTGTNGTTYYGNLSSVILSNIAPDSKGEIAVNMTWLGGAGYINAMEVTSSSAVPEPTTWTMLIGGVGLLGLWQRSRRPLAHRI